MIIDQEYCDFDASTRRLTVFLGRVAGNPEYDVRLRSWEEGGGVEVRQGREWQRNDEAFDYPVSSAEVAELDAHHPVRAYYDTLPGNAALALRQFASHQCRLIHVLRQYPLSEEMASSAPFCAGRRPLFWVNHRAKARSDHCSGVGATSFLKSFVVPGVRLI